MVKLLAAALLALGCGSAWGQTPVGPGAPSPALLWNLPGSWNQPQLFNWPVTITLNDTYNGTQQVVENQNTCYIALIGTVSGQANVCSQSTEVLAGSGSVLSNGHGVAYKGLLIFNGTGAIDHGNAVQPTFSMGSTGTISLVNLGVGFIEQIAAGGTVGQLNGWACPSPDPAGTITGYNCLYQPALTSTQGGTVGNKYFALNLEPSMPMLTKGEIINSTNRELGPTVSPGVVSGRYYYGILPASSGSTIQNLLSNIWISPFYVPERTTYTKIGLSVVTPQTGGLCSLGIYSAIGGSPAGSVIVTASNLDGSTSGNKEGVVSQQLDAGFYFLAAQCNNNAIQLSMYLENDAQIMGSSVSPTNGDTTAYIFNGSFGVWPSNPALQYINKGGAMPLLWMRK